MLYYSIDHPDPDINFTVTVVPINGAGPGEPAVTTISLPKPSIFQVLSTDMIAIPGNLYTLPSSTISNVIVIATDTNIIITKTSSMKYTNSITNSTSVIFIAPADNNGIINFVR